MSESAWIDEARQIAAQCWCDPETSDRIMDPALCEAVAKRIALWMDTGARFARNEDFYRGLLDECAKYLGPEVFTDDDGGIHTSPLRLKIPGLVYKLKCSQPA